MLTKGKLLLCTIGVECGVILSIGVACALNSIGSALFYNLGYGLLISVALPLAIALKNKETLAAFGMRPLHARQYIVLAAFVIFSIGGQLIPLLASGAAVRFDLLPICILPLVMTTFFEEFLFRGFFQARLEKQFGWPVAVLCSGLLFSLYHLGYPGFRRAEDLLLLFAVGLGFAAAYKLSGNHFWVAYFVNLPNAFLTYILKSGQFPVFTWDSSLYAAMTIVLAVALCFVFQRRARRQKAS